jgi:signal peptidase II
MMSRKAAFFLPIFITGVILDQLTKVWVLRDLALGDRVPVIDGLFNLVHVHNRGAAFGLLSGSHEDFARIFFICTALVVVGVVGYLLWRLPAGHPRAGLGYSLIITGAVGNLLDRLRLGEVVDFLDFYWRNHHWPAFNVADTLVCLGAAALAWAILKDEAGDYASDTV